MKEAFFALRDFFMGAGYSVFAAGCILGVLTESISLLTILGSFIFAMLLLTLSWVSAMAGRGPA